MFCVYLCLNRYRKTCPVAFSSTTNPTWTDLGSNPSLQCNRLTFWVMAWPETVLWFSSVLPCSFFFLSWLDIPSGLRPLHCRGFVISRRHATLGRTPLDEWSARRRDLYLTTHNYHELPVGFRPAIPKSERLPTHAVDRAANGISFHANIGLKHQIGFCHSLANSSCTDHPIVWRCISKATDSVIK
jgi:hypothetical protein